MAACADERRKSHRITGRSDDMLVIRGINVFPSQIEHVLLKIPEVGNQFMVYIDRINHLDEMTVEVEINREFFSGELADLAKIQKKVVKELRDALELRTTVRLVEPGSLPDLKERQKESLTEGRRYDEELGSTNRGDAKRRSPENAV